MKKNLVFTKSISFEKGLIDRLEEHLMEAEEQGKKINFSSEVTRLIEAGLQYRQLERDLASGKKPQLASDAVMTTGKARLKDLLKERIEFDETALEQPTPVKGIRINKI